ncbi:MAG: adenylyltransferase, partial [Omnitrophica WOR_2 bacterium RIFCSPHIGHO2_02_FULL_68_15]
MPALTREEQERYQRQMRLEGWGEAGQQRLKQASVLIVGAGGLGSPAALYLAAAGVGTLRICDSDAVELSNLNRQILHAQDRLGINKAQSAQRTLEALNPQIRVVAIAEHLDETNVERVLGDAELILDCLDNFPTRYLLSDTALHRHIPMIHAAVWGLEGRLTVLAPPATPCLRCLYPESPPKETFPVVGAAPGVLGCLQAMEALKWLTGLGTPLTGRLLV